MIRKLLVLASIAALSALAGCRPFAPATPPGFVDLSDSYSQGEYRATTAEGMVLGVRAFENKPKGEIAFWTKVIENRMRDTSGYALLETKDVKDRVGDVGKQLRFGHDESGVPHLYYVSIFVNDDHVYVLEAGGTKDLVTKHEQQITWSIENFLPK